jgi:ATP-binding protein involved in chromosome partitioning
MSSFACPHCGEATEIFGRGGASRLADAEGLELLGRIPLELAVRQGGDAGIPAVAQREAGPAAVAMRELAGLVASRLAVRAASESAPTLTVA